MYKKILREFTEKYLQQNNTLNGLADVCERVHLGISPTVAKTLRSFSAELAGPVKIGVIGHFSSGKSTMLNMFLPKPVLATGARPVSAFAVYIRHGEFKMLAIKGGEIYEASGLQNNQNSSDARPDALIIFSPDERLANIELVDTPGLNANNTDENTSMALLDSFDAILWLTHASAAGKASEKKAIMQLKTNRKYCLITQADLLDDQAQQETLAHTQSFFGPLFEGVALFSAKGKTARAKDGGMSELLGFFNSLKIDDKKHKIQRHINEFKSQITHAHENLRNDLLLLLKLLQGSCARAEQSALSTELITLSEDVLVCIKNTAEKIAAMIAQGLHEQTSRLFVPSKKLLQKGSFVPQEYHFKNLRPSDVCADIFYHNDAFNKELKQLKKAMRQRFEKLQTQIEQIYSELESAALRERTRVLGSKRSSVLSENFIQPALRYYGAISSRVLRPFERISESAKTSCMALSERLEAKALNNFETACALTCSFIYERINIAREYYEQNPAEFKLYVPNQSEIERRLLGDLYYYEFEETLINKRALQRIAEQFAANYKQATNVLEAQIQDDLAAADARYAEICEHFNKVLIC